MEQAPIIEWNETRVAKACLASFPFFGSRTLRKLRSAYPNPAWAWLASPEALVANGAPEQAAMKFTDWRSSVDPEKLIRQLDLQGIRVLFRDDPGYPQSFQMSSNPPEILFVRGVLEDRPSVAVVGTRRMTSYGRQCVAAIVPDLVRSGLSIISGLALGVDAEAHKTTIENEGYTVAILGTGVDDDAIYPRENFQLAQRIISQGGAVISEFPPGTDSRREHFPMRNRLIATLSAATLVIEASEDSGSLITAKSALEENREVLSVPGPIWSDQTTGRVQLRRNLISGWVCRHGGNHGIAAGWLSSLNRCISTASPKSSDSTRRPCPPRWRCSKSKDWQSRSEDKCG